MGEVISHPATASIDPDTDRLLDVIEGGGLNLYVLRNEAGQAFLAFEDYRPSPTAEAARDSVEASRKLSQLFQADPALRMRVVDYALAVGAFYRPA